MLALTSTLHVWGFLFDCSLGTWGMKSVATSWHRALAGMPIVCVIGGFTHCVRTFFGAPLCRRRIFILLIRCDVLKPLPVSLDEFIMEKLTAQKQPLQLKWFSISTKLSFSFCFRTCVFLVLLICISMYFPIHPRSLNLGKIWCYQWTICLWKRIVEIENGCGCAILKGGLVKLLELPTYHMMLFHFFSSDPLHTLACHTPVVKQAHISEFKMDQAAQDLGEILRCFLA